MMLVHLPVRVTQALRLLACSTVMVMAALTSVSGRASESVQAAASGYAAVSEHAMDTAVDSSTKAESSVRQKDLAQQDSAEPGYSGAAPDASLKASLSLVNQSKAAESEATRTGAGQTDRGELAIGQVSALRLKQRMDILRWSGLPDLSTQMHQSVVALKTRPDQQQRLLLALLPWSHASLTQPLDQHLRQYDDETLLRLHDALAHPILQRGRDAERAALEDQQAGTSYWQYRQRLLKHPPNIRRMSRIDALLAASHTQPWLDVAQSAFQRVVAVRSDETKHDDGQSRELLSWSDEARLFLLYAYRGISNAELDAMLAAWQEPVLQAWLSDASARLPGPG